MSPIDLSDKRPAFLQQILLLEVLGEPHPQNCNFVQQAAWDFVAIAMALYERLHREETEHTWSWNRKRILEKCLDAWRLLGVLAETIIHVCDDRYDHGLFSMQLPPRWYRNEHGDIPREVLWRYVDYIAEVMRQILTVTYRVPAGPDCVYEDADLITAEMFAQEFPTHLFDQTVAPAITKRVLDLRSLMVYSLTNSGCYGSVEYTFVDERECVRRIKALRIVRASLAPPHKPI
jgi:hypothetical protein